MKFETIMTEKEASDQLVSIIKSLRKTLKSWRIEYSLERKDNRTYYIRCSNGRTGTISFSTKVGFICFVYNVSRFNWATQEGFSQEEAANMSVEIIGEMDELIKYLKAEAFSAWKSGKSD